MVAAPHWS